MWKTLQISNNSLLLLEMVALTYMPQLPSMRTYLMNYLIFVIIITDH